jgi:hypothetical protein
LEQQCCSDNDFDEVWFHVLFGFVFLLNVITAHGYEIGAVGWSFAQDSTSDDTPLLRFLCFVLLNLRFFCDHPTCDGVSS